MVKVGFQKTDISTHDAEMWYLLTLNPEIHSLRTHSKKFGCLAHRPRAFIAHFRAGLMLFPAIGVARSLDGQEQAEAFLHALARQFDGDPAATDSTRVLRLPGFANKKYDEDFQVAIPLQPASQRPRRLCPGLQHRVAPKQSLRERKGTLLATSVHKPRQIHHPFAQGCLRLRDLV